MEVNGMYSRPEGGSKGNSFGTFLDTLKRNEQAQQQQQQQQQQAQPAPSPAANGLEESDPQPTQAPTYDTARLDIVYVLSQPESSSLPAEDLRLASGLSLDDFVPALQRLIDLGQVTNVAQPGKKKTYELTPEGKKTAEVYF
jgi:predicted transcriptional regulator